MVDPPRSAAQRKADALARLTSPAVDVFVATASAAGVAHLVPLSLLWHDDHLVIALEASSVTARNLAAGGKARCAVGPTRDVVLIDAEVADRWPADGVPPEIADAYAAQADWDPRGLDGFTYVRLRPTRLQTWREVNEIAGRTILRDGTWLV